MTDDHDVTQIRFLDVGDDRIHPLTNGGGGEISGLIAMAWQVYREDAQSWFLAAQLGNRQLPAVGSVLSAVDEDEGGQSHGSQSSQRSISCDASTSISVRKSLKLRLAGSMVIHVTPASA
ncbi:hypothetical protein GCM10009632_13010 [Mycolicibacterium alvei]|uniref:Uncharacterized protein n=1 Tax=Mycolicibacterium alvei TaxID=67081 RepID=A0A6N4UU30_9MYCO|nr:hypothetical protein MALV_21560 [Mycolicibacterium alvei]